MTVHLGDAQWAQFRSRILARSLPGPSPCVQRCKFMALGPRATGKRRRIVWQWRRAASTRWERISRLAQSSLRTRGLKSTIGILRYLDKMLFHYRLPDKMLITFNQTKNSFRLSSHHARVVGPLQKRVYLSCHAIARNVQPENSRNLGTLSLMHSFHLLLVLPAINARAP